MKSEAEKKLRRVSTRMTEEQYRQIKQKASDSFMSVSGFMVNAATHGRNQLTPMTAMELQIYFNEAADALEMIDPELSEQLRSEGDAVWKLL